MCSTNLKSNLILKNSGKPDDIVKKIEYAIEQHESFLKVMSLDQLKELEKNNIKRRF